MFPQVSNPESNPIFKMMKFTKLDKIWPTDYLGSIQFVYGVREFLKGSKPIERTG